MIYFGVRMKNKRTRYIVYFKNKLRGYKIFYSRYQYKKFAWYGNEYMRIDEFYKQVFRRDKQNNISFWNNEPDRWDRT